MADLIAAGLFNEGYSSILQVLNGLKIRIGSECRNFTICQDSIRLDKQGRCSLSRTKEARTAARMDRMPLDEMFEEEAGLLYGPGIADYILRLVSKSNSREVTLTDVKRETSGEFKCEVSADAPLFHTDIREAHLLVADIPEDEPVLRTEVQKVAPGAKIRANCTTPGSYPPMNVTWFINDVEIHPKFGVQIEEAVNRYEALNDLDTVTSTISVRAVQDLFKNGKMKLKCLATLYSLYRRDKEVDLQEDAPLLALIMVPTTHSNEGINSGFRHSSSSKQPYYSTYMYILIYLITRLMIR